MPAQYSANKCPSQTILFKRAIDLKYFKLESSKNFPLNFAALFQHCFAKFKKFQFTSVFLWEEYDVILSRENIVSANHKVMTLVTWTNEPTQENIKSNCTTQLNHKKLSNSYQIVRFSLWHSENSSMF